MQKFAALTVMGILISITSFAWAQDEQGKGKFAGKFEPGMILKKLDENGDGKISKDEFKKLSERLGKGDATKGEKMFEKLDTNSDGFISEDEFKKMTEMRGKLGDLKGKMTPEQMEKLKEKLGKGKTEAPIKSDDLKDAFEKAAKKAEEESKKKD